jgi:hypothetical protein
MADSLEAGVTTEQKALHFFGVEWDSSERELPVMAATSPKL